MLLELKLVSSFCSDQRYLYMVMPPERNLPCTGIADRMQKELTSLSSAGMKGERSRAPLTFMLLELKLVSSFCMRSAIPGTWSCRQREHLPCTGIADRMQKELTSLSSSSMKVRGASPAHLHAAGAQAGQLLLHAISIPGTWSCRQREQFTMYRYR